MQFRLRSLIILTTALAVFLGIVFGPPPAVSCALLTLIMLASPGVWIAGASFGEGAKGAFFRGGLIAGILPFIACSYTSTVLSVVLTNDGGLVGGDFSRVALQFIPWGELITDEHLALRLTLATLWLMPGAIACLGGTMGWITYKLVAPQPKYEQPTTPATDYRVVAGRLTTTNEPPA
jgi:hypothetical protein